MTIQDYGISRSSVLKGNHPASGANPDKGTMKLKWFALAAYFRLTKTSPNRMFFFLPTGCSKVWPRFGPRSALRQLRQGDIPNRAPPSIFADPQLNRSGDHGLYELTEVDGFTRDDSFGCGVPDSIFLVCEGKWTKQLLGCS